MPVYYFMLIETSSWTGGAVWREQDGIRVCIDADPILSWMLETSYSDTKAAIAKRRWQCEEIKEREYNTRQRDKKS